MLNATKKLPANASLRHLKTQAKDLLALITQKSGDAAKRIKENLPKYSFDSLEEIFDKKHGLQEVQLVIAREYGFVNWVDLKEYVEIIERQRGHEDEEDVEYVRKVQYRDDRNLSARIAMHSCYTPQEYNLYSILWNMYSVRADDRFLDIGCGNGMFWLDQSARIPEGLSLTIVDTSAGMLEVASEKLRDLPLQLDAVQGEIESLDFADESFDMIHCAFVMHLVGDVGQAIREVHRVLKPGGQAFITCMDPDNMVDIPRVIERVDPKLNYVKRSRSLSRSQETIKQACETFTSVDVTQYEYTMQVDDAQMIVDYARSFSMLQKRRLSGEFWERLESTVAEEVEQKGYFGVYKAAKIVQCAK